MIDRNMQITSLNPSSNMNGIVPKEACAEARKRVARGFHNSIQYLVK